MKLLPACVLLACFGLAGCLPSGSLPGIGSSSRYDINSYAEDKSQTADLTGLWIAVHEGTLKETTDGVDYTVTGNIREIVAISKSGGVYQMRTCLEPETLHVLSVSGDQVSVDMNDEHATLTLSSNTVMSGTASHNQSDSKYSGTLKMKKVAPLGDSFGLFSYISDSQAVSTETAGCLQEGSLHVVGSKLGFSKWADVELANITDWSSATFRQTGYLYSRGGTADPVRQLRFMEGTASAGATVREYPESGESVSASVTATSAEAYTGAFVLSGKNGSVKLDLPFVAADALVVTTGSAAASSSSGASTSGSEFDILSMFQWVIGIFNIRLPW